MKKLSRYPASMFSLLLAFELIFFLTLIVSGRMVKGHDGFIHFSLQYYFLNHVVHFGDIPLWMPYMTHGSLAGWWYTLQAGLLQNVLLFSGGLLQSVNFLPIYDCEMLVDELALVLGTWLLARRLFKSEWTCLFVSLTAAGSCIWMTQPWFNFHFYYCVPLILYFGHWFLDTGQWRYAFLAGNLLVFQLMGNLPYFLPMIAFVVILYFILYLACNGGFGLLLVRVTKDWQKAAFVTAALIVNVVLAYALLSAGSGEIVNYNYERELNSRVSSKVFLHYGNNQELSRWLELVLGVSPSQDYTLYIGILCLPLAFLGLANLRRRHRHIAWLLLLLFLISQGTVVAGVFYYIWPMMKYYRHLSLLGVFIKLFLILLAGVGFEALFKKRPLPGRFQWPAVVLSIIFLIASGWLFYLSGHYQQAAKTVANITKGLVPLGRYEAEIVPPVQRPPTDIQNLFSSGMLGVRMAKSGLLCAAAAALLLYTCFYNHWGYRRWLLFALITVQSLDIMHYKISEMRVRTTVLDKTHAAVTEFKPLPYYVRRSPSFNTHDERTQLLWETLPYPGILHWTLNAFLFKDQLDHPYRTDYWLKPLDKFVRVLNKQPIDDLSVRPLGLGPFGPWEFPLKSAAALKVAGLADDKIQFFSQAYPASDEWIASRLVDKDYNGGQLLLSAPSEGEEKPPYVSENWRLPLRYKILGFTSNELQVLVEPLPQRAYMFYSDVWHPYWKAAVNDHPAKVFRANLAYKAVALDKGSNIVKLYFHSPMQSALYGLFSLNALFWLGMLLVMLIRETYTLPGRV